MTLFPNKLFHYETRAQTVKAYERDLIIDPNLTLEGLKGPAPPPHEQQDLTQLTNPLSSHVTHHCPAKEIFRDEMCYYIR